MSDLIQFLQRAVQTRSYSDQEGDRPGAGV